MTDQEQIAALTDGEWRAFQSIPDQGYSHRAWIDARIAERLDRVKREAAAQALEDAADRLAEPWALWHGDGGVTVEDPQGVYPRPTLLEWLHAHAATIRTEATA